MPSAASTIAARAQPVTLLLDCSSNRPPVPVLGSRGAVAATAPPPRPYTGAAAAFGPCAVTGPLGAWATTGPRGACCVTGRTTVADGDGRGVCVVGGGGGGGAVLGGGDGRTVA